MTCWGTIIEIATEMNDIWGPPGKWIFYTHPSKVGKSSSSESLEFASCRTSWTLKSLSSSMVGAGLKSMSESAMQWSSQYLVLRFLVRECVHNLDSSCPRIHSFLASFLIHSGPNSFPQIVGDWPWSLAVWLPGFTIWFVCFRVFKYTAEDVNYTPVMIPRY